MQSWLREQHYLFKCICHVRSPKAHKSCFARLSQLTSCVYSHLDVLIHPAEKEGRERDYSGFVMFSFPSYLVIVCLRREDKIPLINSQLLGINAGSSPGK